MCVIFFVIVIKCSWFVLQECRHAKVGRRILKKVLKRMNWRVSDTKRNLSPMNPRMINDVARGAVKELFNFSRPDCPGYVRL